MPTKKPSAKQLAARAKFVKMVRAKAAKSKAAKKVGAIKIVEKNETKLTKPTKVYQQTRTKSGTFKSLKRIAGTTKHKDTKSHNVNIRVVSGIQKTINGMQKTYMAIYQNKGGIINTAIFKASSLLEAKKYASAHKRHSPELKKYKSVSTSVKLYKN